MNKTLESTITLHNGIKIPYLGIGTWQSRGGKCEDAVAYALTHGYSMIDTAQGYNNEEQVGKGWQASGRARADIFITTKISNSNQGYQSTKKSFAKNLKDLQTDYVDLLLIHWPEVKQFSKTVETWRALVELQKEGCARSIGVSNFTIDLTEKLLDEIDVVPGSTRLNFTLSCTKKSYWIIAVNSTFKLRLTARSPEQNSLTMRSCNGLPKNTKKRQPR